MNISKIQIVSIIFLLVATVAFWASKMLVWQPPVTLANWKSSLQKSVSQADKFSIYKIGDDGSRLAFGEADQLKEFFNAITIDESIIETVMMPGKLKITFESDDGVITSLEVVGGNHLRWRNGDWPSDATLTKSSSMALQKWLSDIGVQETE